MKLEVKRGCAFRRLGILANYNSGVAHVELRLIFIRSPGVTTPRNAMTSVIGDRCDIGECLPTDETVEDCRARLSRIVAKQKQCYGSPRPSPLTLGPLMPLWLDADFLYRINYGPGTREDAAHMWDSIMRPIVLRKRKRVQLTLLDRRLVDKLFHAVFKKGSQPPILYSDWDDAKESQTSFPSDQLISPFDYRSHDVYTALYRWCEEFVVQYVWRSDYSSQIFAAKRPPMSAVALDIILLVRYLARLPHHPERSLADRFRKFVRKQSLHSISIGENFDFEWACRGYLWDLYNIVVLYGLTENGLDKYSPKLRDVQDEAQFVRVTWIEHAKFPGGDTLGIECPVDLDYRKEIYGSLADMKASFICSGPFKLALTTRLSDHLTMKDRKVLLYCDKPSKTRRDRGHIPGAGYYGPLTRHILGTYGHLISLMIDY